MGERFPLRQEQEGPEDVGQSLLERVVTVLIILLALAFMSPLYGIVEAAYKDYKNFLDK